jgi:hypothetical protein
MGIEYGEWAIKLLQMTMPTVANFDILLSHNGMVVHQVPSPSSGSEHGI